jgi:signal transduction histidine kinase/CheY-like chemotaxis protein
MMRASARRGGVSWVVKDDEVEKFWHRWRGSVGDDVPKSVVVLPLLAGREVIGGISLADYEKENAFTDLSLNLLETIASNMGTAVQNMRLFEETKRLFAEAEEARAAAEQANKAKSTFLANMSHELRTPLNAIMGFTQIVRGKGEGVLPEKQLDNLDKVTSSSQHLLGLINTVLDIAKIEAGRMEALPARFKLSVLAEQCANLATPLLKPEITLEKQVDESIGVIYSDQDKIKQIALNLLSNAAKFTHAGKIILKVEKLDDKNVAISVKDSGIGISEEAVGRVFEEFQQADNTTTRQYGGTGLGLTISRNLARLLGGDLTATSELGKGSTFTLTIPMNYKIDNASSSDLESDSVHPAESNAETSHTEEQAKRAPTQTILIVEDTELNINLLAQLLEDDYKLLFAKDGAQGVDMAQQEKPDLILMDISLPIMDGYEATRRIRTNMASIPIIGLSAYAMTGDADKAKEAGCNDYVTKPINKDMLLEKIINYLR